MLVYYLSHLLYYNKTRSPSAFDRYLLQLLVSIRFETILLYGE